MNQIVEVKDEQVGKAFIDLDEILLIQASGRVNFKTDQYHFLPNVDDIYTLLSQWEKWKKYKNERVFFTMDSVVGAA